MTTGSATHPVLVVIPVYGDLEATRRCLDSLIASDMPSHVSVLLIDDRCPDESLSALCRDIAGREGYELIVNEQNLGFVASANRGFEFTGEADVVLLNSDTVVTGDWIGRLQACAYGHTSIGTVTPFTNNGTICSYPVFNSSNSLPEQWTAAELDALFSSANSGQSCEIPTAVGFCMYVKRACLNDTGLFDVERFGQGYGEECDFCLRASRHNWTHVVAADVFVFHEGAASFTIESDERKRAADEVIRTIHPQYDALVEEFLKMDPLRTYRDHVDAARIAEKPEDCLNVLDEHHRYAQQLREKLSGELTKAQELAAAYLRDFQQQLVHSETLERLLDECRASFQATDRALTEARAVIDQLNQTVAALNRENSELRGNLHEERMRCADLGDRIRLMEQSRSWRYTAWLRRN